MFRDFNDITQVWYGLACYEETSPDKSNNFQSKSRNSNSRKINAMHLTDALNLYLHAVQQFHCHHTGLIRTRVFWEDLSRWKQQIAGKTHEIRIRIKNVAHLTGTLNDTSMMSCDSKSTILIWYGLACAEKTSSGETINSGEHPEAHNVNATQSTEMLK